MMEKMMDNPLIKARCDEFLELLRDEYRRHVSDTCFANGMHGLLKEYEPFLPRGVRSTLIDYSLYNVEDRVKALKSAASLIKEFMTSNFGAIEPLSQERRTLLSEWTQAKMTAVSGLSAGPDYSAYSGPHRLTTKRSEDSERARYEPKMALGEANTYWESEGFRPLAPSMESPLSEGIEARIKLKRQISELRARLDGI
jgi:hypothetical protein